LTGCGSQCVGIFGGTFDPIHYGHLRTALELRIRLSLAQVRFVPCNIPPTRKQPLLSPQDRLRMVRAAIESEEPHFVLDAREIERGGVSYTVDTLTELRAEMPTTPLALLLGMDAFLSLPSWRQWEKLLSLAHIVVAHRPGWRAPADGLLGDLVAERGTETNADLCTSVAGRVHVEAVTQLEISSTDLRHSISAGIDPKYLVPPSVRSLIIDTECYAKKAEAIL
jgi:nicotinate-nucleotide adenylyltransferase